jgi:Ca-activated chloride channel family protein
MLSSLLHAQEENRLIKDGNDAYKKGDYKKAAELYKKALAKDAKNNTAKYNLGNAVIKQKDVLTAAKYYDEVAASESDEALKAKALYNKGVSEVEQQKLLEAIESFKKALMITPDDDETRENLQKALNDLKKQQQQNQPQAQNKKQKQQQQQNKKQPNPQMMEQKFAELRDKEKQLQKQLQQKPNASQPDKDW